MITMTQPVSNPITGVFGSGNVRWFSSSGSWAVPMGVNTCRVRLWGAGGGTGGSGGGFAMLVINDLSAYSSVSVAVGGTTSTTAPGGTSSFGPFVSATGGGASGGGSAGGTGIGGDINFSGGNGGGSSAPGGGSASVLGNGGNHGSGSNNSNGLGGAGGGTNSQDQWGGSGFMAFGGFSSSVSPFTAVSPSPGMYLSSPSIDFIGTGGGGSWRSGGINGGGGGGNGGMTPGGWPGGGGGHSSSGGAGLVIVEW